MTPETLRIWVRQTEIDTGDREGITSEAKERVRQLERENAELKRANEIRCATSIFSRVEAGSVNQEPNETSSSVHRRE